MDLINICSVTSFLCADLLVWEQGTKNALEQLEISGGNKGIVTLDAKVKSADVDIHL